MVTTNTLRTRLWLAVFALAPAGCPTPPANAPTDAGAGAGVVLVHSVAVGAMDAGVVVPDRELVHGATCVPRATADAHAKSAAEEPKDIPCPSTVDGSLTTEPRGARGDLARWVTRLQRNIGADVCCYDTRIIEPVKGRAYVDDGALVTSALPHTRGAARRWLDDAALEHASIASFARATLELMAVGAPLSLIRETQQAALDEVKHAELCLEVARSFGAPVSTFGPLRALPPRDLDLAALARACLAEACVGETIAAAHAHEEAARSTGRVGEVLRIIAEDEERHAALAWRTLRWLVDVGGAPVFAALRDYGDVNDELSREILTAILDQSVAT